MIKVQFRVTPVSGNLLVLDATASSVARTLLLLRDRRIAWVVLRDDKKYFVFTKKEVMASLKSASQSTLLTSALRLHQTKPNVTVKNVTARVSLGEVPTSGRIESRAVVLRKSKTGRLAVSTIGLLKRDLQSQKKAKSGSTNRAAIVTHSLNRLPGATHLSRAPAAAGVLFGFGDHGHRKKAPERAVGSPRSFSVIDVFYATDRSVKSSNSQDSMVQYLNRLPAKSRLDYGICSVTIPDGHRMGKIESPSIWSFTVRENPEKHFTICGCVRRPALNFFKELRSRVNECDERSCFVFIHGYNVSFDAAAKRTAQLACDLKFLGVPILYSWASAANWRKYPKDVETVDMTADSLTKFLVRLTRISAASNIHLIAHSMGNRAMVKALKQMSAASGAKPFRQIVLTAPDVPRQNVEPLIRATCAKAERVTLYASSKDKALGLSKIKNDYARLGKVYGFPFVFDGMDSIDASSVKTDFWEHTVFAKTRTVLGDLAALLTDGHPPDKRFGLKRVISPDGVSWIIV